MEILITDVTEMGGGNFCVAGWNGQAQSMVRPLPSGGNWAAHLINLHHVRPGVTIGVTPTGHSNGSYPHRTEDTPIDSGSIHVIDNGPPDWMGPASPPRAATVDAAFGGNVVENSEWNGRLQGIHVPVGTQSCSLWGLDLPRASLAFVEDFDKLKAMVDDGDCSYMVSVSARDLKIGFRAGGANAVNALLPNGGQLHVRLGLARAWSGQPDKCYVMVNGVYW